MRLEQRIADAERRAAELGLSDESRERVDLSKLTAEDLAVVRAYLARVEAIGADAEPDKWEQLRRLRADAAAYELAKKVARILGLLPKI
jgi:hypothetical protein